MPDYSKGKIYTIRCKTDDSLIYVGSTINPLSKRWGQHKSDCNSKRDKYNLLIYRTIRDNNGIDNWYIELYENFICNSKDELHKREGEITRLIGNLNGSIAGRDRQEWFNEHKEEKKTYDKIYCNLHREEKKEKEKIYYIENKDRIKERKLINYTCICGSTLRLCSKAVHERSIKHTNFINPII